MVLKKLSLPVAVRLSESDVWAAVEVAVMKIESE